MKGAHGSQRTQDPVSSGFDDGILAKAREHLRQFVLRSSQEMSATGRMLDIGAQGRTYVRDSFPGWVIESLDLVDDYNPDYVGDITLTNEAIPDHHFDAVCCLEVLEHTVDPFAVIHELRRILKPGGVLLISAPVNFRIHGPLPDCWRFTEYGWRVLLKDFEILELDTMESPDRALFPVKYNIRARVDHASNINPRTITFRRIE